MNQPRIQRPLRRLVLLCLGACLLGVTAAGCSHGGGGDFASMSKAEQMKAARNLPPEELAVGWKMWNDIQAAKQAKSAQSGSAPAATSPGALR